MKLKSAPNGKWLPAVAIIFVDFAHTHAWPPFSTATPNVGKQCKKQRARAPVKQQTETERRLVGMKQQQEANRNQACLEIGKQVNCNSFGWLGHVLVQLLGLLSLILAMPEQ